MDKLFELWETGLVQRWHNMPYVPSQVTGQHVYGMLVMLMKMHPNPSRDLYEAILQHDGGEYGSLGCDFPHPQKQQYPILKVIDEEFTNNYLEYFELRKPELTEDDKLWLKYLDQAEAYLYLKSLQSNDPRVGKVKYNCEVRCIEAIEELKKRGFTFD